MTDKKTELKHKLQASRQKLIDALQDLSDDQWQIQVQSDEDQWTVLQMVRHLQDAHTGLTGQIQRMLGGGETVPRDFDIDRWNKRTQTKTTELTSAEAIETLNQSHANLMGIVDNLQDEDFEKRGWSAWKQQEVSLEAFLMIISEHEAFHTGEIANALADN